MQQTEFEKIEIKEKGIGFEYVADFGIILENYRLLERIIEKGYKLKTLSSYHLDYDWYIYENKTGKKILIAVSQGAPMAVDLLERYVSGKVKKIIRIGTGGALKKEILIGDAVIPYASIRDEGTSFFYIDKKAPALADIKFSENISALLMDAGQKVHQGIAWSTDGRWKETDEMVQKYIDSGAIVADMESSAIFAAGINRKVSVSSISVISDSIIHDEGADQKGLQSKEIWFKTVLPAFDVIFDTVAEKGFN